MTNEMTTAEFLMSTVTRANGFSPKMVDVMAEVLWQVEKGKRLEEENERFRQALLQIAHGDTWTAYPHDIAAWALKLEKDK